MWLSYADGRYFGHILLRRSVADAAYSSPSESEGEGESEGKGEGEAKSEAKA